MRKLTISISVLATLAFVSIADAATVFEIRGGGNGHGIGMSQYGAYGYALQGKDYRFILSHYYQGTALGSVSPGRTVRVLIGVGSASFSGATRATGPTGWSQKLTPGATYSVRSASGGQMTLYNQAGKKLATFGAPLGVSGSGPLDLAGHGSYRGAFEFRAVGGAVQTVNAVGVDDYVRGVVAAEMPASWAPAALEAQAVAARTYAITSNVGGDGYQLYPDTRSQMYGGLAAEAPASNAAVAATSGQILTYHGTAAVAFFFASSGGYTENIENVWLGAAPEPWLRGVPDPYDGVAGNPYHRWTYRMSLAAAAAKLSGLVKGRFRGIRVIRRGVSPRVIDAQVVGTGGTSSVTGPQLQALFGLPSTYMRFTTVSAVRLKRPKLPRAALDHVHSPQLEAALRTPALGVSGVVFPAMKGAVVTVQRHTAKGWRTVRALRLDGHGAYSAALALAGSYRILYEGVVGPTVPVS